MRVSGRYALTHHWLVDGEGCSFEVKKIDTRRFKCRAVWAFERRLDSSSASSADCVGQKDDKPITIASLSLGVGSMNP
jgi:hypothetical protein